MKVLTVLLSKSMFNCLGVLHVCRALMISSISLGFIAINVTVFGMKCVIVGSSNPRAKAIIALIGGCFFGISGEIRNSPSPYSSWFYSL